jgi:signal transduction histidine kinase
MMVEEIAHQVRNPIVSIGGYSKRLLKTLPRSRKTKPYLEQIIRETQRLEAVVRRVEEYVLIPKPAFHKERIVEVVESAIQAFSQEVTDERISFTLGTKALEGDGLIFLNRDLVSRALIHILQNSVDAILTKPMGKKHGSVSMTLFGNGERIRVSISDNGEGIPKKNLDHIFDPFFSTRPDRVGLGLTFVKRVMEEHGGSVQIDSRLRRGTTLTLILPKDRRRKVRQELVSPEAKVFSSLS